MALEGVIFDLGHTLMRLDGTWSQVFERGVADLAACIGRERPGLDGEAFAQALLARRREGFARAQETMREVTAEESMRWAFARFGLTPPDPALVRGAIDAFFAYEDTCWTADPAAVPVLRVLAAQGLRLGMFSNATDDIFIQALVDRLHFRPWLAPALTSAWTGIRKPDPAAFAPILASWGVPARTVVLVGDTLEADILGAQRAGMRGIWFPSREHARQEDINDSREGQSEGIVPDAKIWNLADLPHCLERLAGREAGAVSP
jgi:HAD superfamily hydrolase (TIGR01549 family)